MTKQRHLMLPFERPLLLLAAILALAACSTGCTRAFYRRQADIDAYSLVREKANHPHWRLENYTISVDPRSRMYDPYAIDCPPIPPDDPTSHQLMHCVDNKRGWPFWHDNGERPYIENPAWPEYIEVDSRGMISLSGDDAVRLALLHSRTYQQNLETLYLSALDVSFERFRFDSQFFAGYNVFGTFDGRARSGLARQTGEGGNSSSVLNLSTFPSGGWRMQKLTTTGGTILADFANSLVWQFSGPDDYSSNTLLDFTIIQPLLRNAGRDRQLERLTRAERVLLANVRQMEQYRQGFYVDIMTGSGGQPGPTRAGGQFGSGLEGFTGVATVGFGGGGGGATTGVAAPGAAGGYLALLQAQREIRNQEDNVRGQRRNVARLTTMLEEQPAEQTAAYLSQGLQVAQARQALLGAETNLLTQQNAYQADLDTFKTGDIGLPPMICIQPVDTLLDQFVLIDPAIIKLPEEWETILTAQPEARRTIPERIQANVEAVPAAVPAAPPTCRLKKYDELESDLQKLRPALAQMQQFADRIVKEYLPTIQNDIARFQAAAPRRKAWIQRLVSRIAELQQTRCELLPLSLDPLEATGGGVRGAASQLARIEEALADAEKSYANLKTSFAAYSQSLNNRARLLEELIADPNQTPEQLFEKLVRGVFNPRYECGKTRVIAFDVVEDITRELTELQLLQALVRTESVELGEIDLGADQALEVARKYRRDWMNQRAQLVDSWRLIQFNADQLQSTLDVFFSGDVGNIGDNPFKLRGITGRLRTGVQFDAPITRLSERNTYRQSLIEFQQARRSYYSFEDNVARSLRAQLRSIFTFQLNFELQRLAVIQAAQQVMLNSFIDLEDQRALTTRATAARDAVQALNDLLDAQNQFMRVWVTYEVVRMSLDLQLGTMQLDQEGRGIDPVRIGPDYGQNDPWLRQFKHAMGGLGGPEEITPPPGAMEPQRLPAIQAAPHEALPGPPLPAPPLPPPPGNLAPILAPPR